MHVETTALRNRPEGGADLGGAQGPIAALAEAPRPHDALADELREMRAIYERIYPTQRLRYVLRRGSDPFRPECELHEQPFDLRPQDLGAGFLGVIERPPLGGDPREVTIVLALPRPPAPEELLDREAPWRPVRRLDWLFRASPLAYETVRYQAEMMRRRRFARADRGPRAEPIPLARPVPLPGAPARPAAAARPAILIGMHWLETGGAEKLGFDSITWALEAGLRVFVVAAVPCAQRLAAKLPQHPDLHFIRLDRYLPHHLWPRFITALALAENIGLLHIHHCNPLYPALPTIRARLPWMRVIDSSHVVEYANGGYPRISAAWTRFIDDHHVISGDLVGYLGGRFGVPADKLHLGRMLDRAGHAPAPLRLTPGQTRLHVAFVGRLTYQKRPVVLVLTLRAIAAWARRNGVAFTASLVGEGPFADTVAALLRRYGLEDRVEQLPAGTDVPALLARADLLLLPSNNEGLALVCYEAVQQGCIPISTDVGAQSELLPPDLLLPLAPRAAVRGAVRVIDRMWRDGAFLARQAEALAARYAALSADPTADEVLMPIYRRHAGLEEDE